MLAQFLLSALLTAFPASGSLDETAIRSALEIAAAPEPQRRAFLEKYRFEFGRTAGEQAASVEVFTPFREVIERALREFRVQNSYREHQAALEARQSPALRILVRLVLPLNHVQVNSALPFGSAYRLILSYRTEQDRSTRITIEPRFTVTQTCQGVICLPFGNSAVDGAILETSLPLTASPLPKPDLRGPLTVTVVGPSSQQRTARFQLANLR